MVVTLTPPFRSGVGSETRKKAGSAVRQATDCGFCFPKIRATEFENNSALPWSVRTTFSHVGWCPTILFYWVEYAKHEADDRIVDDLGAAGVPFVPTDIPNGISPVSDRTKGFEREAEGFRFLRRFLEMLRLGPLQEQCGVHPVNWRHQFGKDVMKGFASADDLTLGRL